MVLAKFLNCLTAHSIRKPPRTFGVGCKDQIEPGEWRCPKPLPNVDLNDCSFSEQEGASQFHGIWRDPDFDSRQDAFYYMRVLQNPTCRWSTWDALRNGWALLDDVPATIQERAWSSPIWYESESKVEVASSELNQKQTL